MTVFAKGDYVVCESSFGTNLMPGVTYTVADVHGHNGGQMLVLNGRPDQEFLADRFIHSVTTVRSTIPVVKDLDGFPATNPAPTSDMVFRPAHYARFVIEPITFINANKLGSNIANVIKYACRYDAKNGVEDLKKARRYLDIQIECMTRDQRVADGEPAGVVWGVPL